MSTHYSIRTSSCSITIKTGSEGPYHDPYAYEEWTVVRKKTTYVLRMGLGIWLKVNGVDRRCKRKGQHKDWENATIARFERLVGFKIHEMTKWIEKARHHCSFCGSRHLIAENGYPGETLYICANPKCERISHTDFNEEAII